MNATQEATTLGHGLRRFLDAEVDQTGLKRAEYIVDRVAQRTVEVEF